MSSNIRIVYITFPDQKSAEEIARILVDEKLAACVNIYPAIKSLYKWQGGFCSESEIVVLAKTEAKLVPELMTRVKELHSYECPAMLSLTVDEAYKPYEAWINSELQNAHQ